MKKLVSVICGLAAFSAVSAKAQIDLGVSDFPDSTEGEALEQQLKQDSNGQKSFSIFDKAVSLFGSSKSVQEPKNVNIDELKTEADKGDVKSLLDMGYLYLYGSDGISVDHKKALEYYTKAAEKKNAVALNNLGSLYFNGIGTEIDYRRAIGYFDEAARLGSDDAAVNLAIIYLGSDVKSQEELSRVAELLKQAEPNNNIAKYLSGYSYLKGFLVKQDYKKAFPLIKAAADAGYDEAQFILADFYINGWGTPKNYSRAVQYLNSAAVQGNAEAMLMLGDILSEGKIYTRDIKRAHVQYNIAAVMGVDKAASKRDALEKNIKIEDLLAVQSEAEDYAPQPTEQTAFIRQTYGNSLKAYVDLNLKIAKKLKKQENKK